MLEPTPGEPHTLSGGGGGGGPRKGLFERVKAILLTPKTEWPVIDGEAATVGGLITGYALILAAIAPIALLLGFFIGPFGGALGSAMGLLIKILLLFYVVSLGTVVLLGFAINLLAPALGGTKDAVQAMKLAVYSGTAFWVAGIILLLPDFYYFWAVLGIGYGGYILWLGLPTLMRAPADKAPTYAGASIGIWFFLFFVLWQLAWRTVVSSIIYGAAAAYM